METNQRSFEDKPQYKKGTLGEEIVKSMFREKGWMIYSPEKNGPHYFDILATWNKEKVIAIDVKTKARLNIKPATGIDLKHYKDYQRFSSTHNIDFYLFFIDDKNGDIHYQEIKQLKDPFIIKEKIICWPLDCMNFYGRLTQQQIAELSRFDTRSYTYCPVENSPFL
jgi:hypothetical protein